MRGASNQSAPSARKVARVGEGAQFAAMVDRDTSDAQDGGAAAPAPAPKRSFSRRHWGKMTLLALVASPLIVFALWAAVTLNWSYSSGQRAGYVQKISRKGYVCKTWEGTLYTDIAKGFRSDSFSFTVRNDSIARVIERLSGKRVTMHYEQHIGVPTSCFGETEYFVSRVDTIPE
jgi:hypothetical protein